MVLFEAGRLLKAKCRPFAEAAVSWLERSPTNWGLIGVLLLTVAFWLAVGWLLGVW